MLLEFRTENYKSFKDETIFSMKPAPKQKGLDYSILHEDVENKDIKSLSVATVYGANAAGKTSIFAAMQTFRHIVARGNILNQENASTNAADCFLELIPNSSLKKEKPVSFSAEFVHNRMLFKYTIRIYLGTFMDKEYKRSIKKEELTVNGDTVFLRDINGIKLYKCNKIAEFLNNSARSDINAMQSIANGSLNETELFLTNGFKSLVSTRISSLVSEYFASNLVTHYHSDRLQSYPVFDAGIMEDNSVNSVLRSLGIKSNKLVYVKNRGSRYPALFSKMGEKFVLSEHFESYGTLRLVNMFPVLASAILNGRTVVIDELDASIHPFLIISIINAFHNDEINKKKAQLIFNTHNPVYLNGNVLRRDEIKFVERDDITENSTHYSLSDFGTKGSNARKGMNFMKNYLASRYGATKDIDLSDAFIDYKEKGEKNARKATW